MSLIMLANVVVVLLASIASTQGAEANLFGDGGEYNDAVFLVAHGRHTTFATQLQADSFAEQLVAAVAVSTGREPSALRPVHIRAADDVAVVNRSFALLRVYFNTSTPCRAATLALVRAATRNAITALGLLAASIDYTFDDSSKDEGVAPAVNYAIGSLVLVLTTAAATIGFRRRARRRSRSVRFKDLARIEVEMAGGLANAAATAVASAAQEEVLHSVRGGSPSPGSLDQRRDVPLLKLPSDLPKAAPERHGVSSSDGYREDGVTRRRGPSFIL